MAKNKKKFYVVWVGVNPGIYDNWADCQLQIKGFPAAKYKSYKTLEEAEMAYSGSFDEEIGSGEKKPKANRIDYTEIVEKNSISVDAACSGNPGDVEYQGVDTLSKDLIFHQGPFKKGTNNIGEFLALVHALAYAKQIKNEDLAIYSDSRTAMAWVRNKKVKTVLKKDHSNEKLFKLVDRAIIWLHNNSYRNKILKWDTENWGEIPADFGRK